MKSKTIGLLALAFASLSLASSALGAPKDKYDIGKREYASKCAVCHGQSGKGDGGMVDLLKRAPPDLTLLSKRNDGVFPTAHAHAVIDGREMISAHGERDMPIWGNVYRNEGVPAGEYYVDVPYDMEMYARARALALIDYLHRIQSK